MVRRLLAARCMLHPTLRELRAHPPERPPRGLALVMGLVTALVLIAGTVALAVAEPPGARIARGRAAASYSDFFSSPAASSAVAAPVAGTAAGSALSADACAAGSAAFNLASEAAVIAACDFLVSSVVMMRMP